MHVEPHRTADQLAALIRAEARAEVARRLAAVRLALLGGTAPQVAGQVLLSERSVGPGSSGTMPAVRTPWPTAPAAGGRPR